MDSKEVQLRKDVKDCIIALDAAKEALKAYLKEQKSSRNKDNAAANEVKDINDIIQAINSKSPAGIKICREFKSKFGIIIVGAKERSGQSRSTHYDFEIQVRELDGSLVWRRVEHKGSQLCRPFGENETPWAAGVQFYNGPCDKFSISQKYARTWYDMYVGSGSLKKEFILGADIPTFDDWFNKDCRVQGDPKTEFGKELKEKVRAARGPNESLREKRAAVLESLTFTEDDKKTLIQEVLGITSSVLEQKDYWLVLHGNVLGDFHVAWFPNFTISSISSVTMKKNLDLEFEFQCPAEFTFGAILRWGKGAGFSCLRMDLK